MLVNQHINKPLTKVITVSLTSCTSCLHVNDSLICSQKLLKHVTSHLIFVCFSCRLYLNTQSGCQHTSLTNTLSLSLCLVSHFYHISFLKANTLHTPSAVFDFGVNCAISLRIRSALPPLPSPLKAIRHSAG